MGSGDISRQFPLSDLSSQRSDGRGLKPPDPLPRVCAGAQIEAFGVPCAWDARLLCQRPGNPVIRDFVRKCCLTLKVTLKALPDPKSASPARKPRTQPHHFPRSTLSATKPALTNTPPSTPTPLPKSARLLSTVSPSHDAIARSRVTGHGSRVTGHGSRDEGRGTRDEGRGTGRRGSERRIGELPGKNFSSSPPDLHCANGGRT